ncbi:hypothetical protein ABZP36_023026 [Zizania latifolia]
MPQLYRVSTVPVRETELCSQPTKARDMNSSGSARRCSNLFPDLLNPTAAAPWLVSSTARWLGSSLCYSLVISRRRLPPPTAQGFSTLADVDDDGPATTYHLRCPPTPPRIILSVVDSKASGGAAALGRSREDFDEQAVGEAEGFAAVSCVLQVLFVHGKISHLPAFSEARN